MSIFFIFASHSRSFDRRSLGTLETFRNPGWPSELVMIRRVKRLEWTVHPNRSFDRISVGNPCGFYHRCHGSPVDHAETRSCEGEITARFVGEVAPETGILEARDERWLDVARSNKTLSPVEENFS